MVLAAVPYTGRVEIARWHVELIKLLVIIRIHDFHHSRAFLVFYILNLPAEVVAGIRDDMPYGEFRLLLFHGPIVTN